MERTRRDFLKTSGLFLGAAGAHLIDLRAWAQPSPADDTTKPALIVIYLRGGADALNTIIPATESLYYTYRPTLGIARDQVLPITNRFGFHPAMRPLHDLYTAGRLAAIVNVGSTHPTRSHFDAQDFMERAAPGIKSITEGWLNRYLSATQTADDRDLRSVSMQPTLPRSLRGQYPVLAMPDDPAQDVMKIFETLYGCDGEKQAAAELRQGNRAAARIASTLEARGELGQPQHDRIVRAGAASIARLRQLQTLVDPHPHDALKRYPDTRLGEQLRAMAKIIRADQGLEIAALDYNGWDHHAYQGGTQGTHAAMLANLSQSLRAFHDDLGPRMKRTCVLVMSEFGRTARENGNNGSDHGHGGFMLAMGGPVVGGKVYGTWRGLARESLYEGRDLPVHTDFRQVFAETLRALYGFDTDEHDFFPQYHAPPRSLGLLKAIA